MTEPSTTRRNLRIVGYDGRLLIVQMQLLAAVLLLPALTLSRGWTAAVLGLLYFALLLAVFLQAWRMRTTGLKVTVEEEQTESPSSTPTVFAAAPSAPEQPAEMSVEPSPPQPHWTDMAYPDPDVELGLKEAPREERPGESAFSDAPPNR